MTESLGVRRVLLTLPVRKPSKEWGIRVHPDETYRLQTLGLELREDREVYLVEPDLWEILGTEATFSPRALVTSITRQGVLFLWPIRLPGQDGKIDDWNKSALEAADLARERWVRVSSDMHLGAYVVRTTRADLPEPERPEERFSKLLAVAFKDRHITSLEHPVLQRLRGEV